MNPVNGAPVGYARVALERETERVRSAPEGSRNNSLNSASFNLAQLVASGVLEPDEVAEQLCQAAVDAGLGANEIRATIHSGIRAGLKLPRDLSHVGGGVVAGTATDGQLPATDQSLTFQVPASDGAAARWALFDARMRAMIEELAPVDKPVGRRIDAAIVRRSELANLPPVQPLIEGVINKRSAVLLVGATSIGKTFLSLSFACSVGTGHCWLGHPVRRTKVLYVVGEGASGLHDRITAWELAWNTKVTDDDVVFVVRPDSLASQATWRELTELAIETAAGLVILDTLSSLAPEVDETKEAAQMTRRLSDLAGSIDGTALLVHHPGWSDNTRSRGGYQLEANVDEVLVLTGMTDSDLLELKRKKVKEGESGQRIWLRRRSYADSVVIEHANHEEIRVPIRERITVVLTEVGDVGITGPQLKDALALTEQQAPPMYRVLSEMVDAGLALADGPKGRRRYYAGQRTGEVSA